MVDLYYHLIKSFSNSYFFGFFTFCNFPWFVSMRSLLVKIEKKISQDYMRQNEIVKYITHWSPGLAEVLWAIHIMIIWYYVLHKNSMS